MYIYIYIVEKDIQVNYTKSRDKKEE